MGALIVDSIIIAVPGTIAALAALDASITSRVSHRRIESIDDAVNGTEPGDKTISENVQTLVDKADGS